MIDRMQEYIAWSLSVWGAIAITLVWAMIVLVNVLMIAHLFLNKDKESE